jgi:hypothetical protein
MPHISNTTERHNQCTHPKSSAMKTYSLCVLLIGLFTSVAAASADVSVVSTSRALRVAAVNALEDNAPWYVLQEALSASLTASLSDQNSQAMPVKISLLDAAGAAKSLLNGDYDAVIVMGEQLPVYLRGNKFVSVKAVSQIGTPVRVFHFVMRNDDPAMISVLSSAFERATSSASFQETVGRAATMRVVASNLAR